MVKLIFITKQLIEIIFIVDDFLSTTLTVQFFSQCIKYLSKQIQIYAFRATIAFYVSN